MSASTSEWTLPHIDEERCTGCGICVQRCPTSAVEIIDGHAAVVRPWACTFCEICETYCPTGAIGRPWRIEFAPDTKASPGPATL